MAAAAASGSLVALAPFGAGGVAFLSMHGVGRRDGGGDGYAMNSGGGVAQRRVVCCSSLACAKKRGAAMLKYRFVASIKQTAGGGRLLLGTAALL